MKTRVGIALVFIFLVGCANHAPNPTKEMMRHTQDGITFFKNLAELSERNTCTVFFRNEEGQWMEYFLNKTDGEFITDALLDADIQPLVTTGRKELSQPSPPKYILSTRVFFPKGGSIKNEITLHAGGLIFAHGQYGTMPDASYKKIGEKLIQSIVLKDAFLCD